MDELYHTPVRKKRFPTPRSGYKYCYACEQELLLEQFALRKGKPWSYCLSCDRERDAARRQPYASPNPRPNPRNSPKPVPARDGYKWCTACGQEKLREEFHKTRGATCIACERAIDRERNRARRVRKTLAVPKATREGYKVCNTCLDEKPHADFSRVGDGYAGRCKKCHNERYNQAPDNEKEYRKVSRKRNDDRRRDAIRSIDRERKSTEEHHAKRREHENKRKLDPAYRQAVRDANAAWRKNNPLVLREMHRRRKARKRDATVEEVSYQRVLERDGPFCYICYGQPIAPEDLTFDHVIPLQPRQGEPQGIHAESNIKPAHKSCNSRKRNKPLASLKPFDRRGMDSV